MQQDGSASKLEFNVMIVACGPIPTGGLVCAITVTQPVQSWTVIRSHEEFRAVGEALSQLSIALPPCPVLGDVASDVTALVKSRNELQQWLSTVLMHPGARESQHVRSFLINGANMIPSQYETVSWTQFSIPAPRPGVGSPAAAASASGAQASNLDDMDMDDMFFAHDEGDVPHDDNEDDDEIIPSASVRYKPTDEAVTDEDEMELMDLAGEVEMVEDIGSLAQSLGASHLGRCDARSLQLQVEMKHHQGSAHTNNKISGGIVVGGVSRQSQDGGGIGSAISRAAENGYTNTAFNSKPMQSAPKLDSFKLIKVIGKGSFGKFIKRHTS